MGTRSQIVFLRSSLVILSQYPTSKAKIEYFLEWRAARSTCVFKTWCEIAPRDIQHSMGRTVMPCASVSVPNNQLIATFDYLFD
jgi:hypothetical protein